MLQGSCHCRSVTWQLDALPESATACNCTACRRYGALWAYGYEGEDISVSGPTTAYVRDSAERSLSFDFCPRCGCVMLWRSLSPNAEGRRRAAVNLRMTDPALISDLPIDHFDGLERWEDLPRDGRCIRDLWF
jgi:hypothetical protein